MPSNVAERQVDLSQQQEPDLGHAEQNEGRRLDEEVGEVVRRQKTELRK